MGNLNFGKELIKKKIPLISKSPGVYRMLGKKNQVLYVGKAKNLPKRLKDYVIGKNLTIRTNRMLALTHNLEIVTTSSEAEALLLEANLIKKFKPKFNILLKDDKSFPYIFIEKDCDWPQLSKHRGAKNKNGYYFGPFASVGSANWTIKILPYQLCKPCLHLEQILNSKNIIKEFLRKGGLRCEVLVSGKVKIGDKIKIL